MPKKTPKFDDRLTLRQIKQLEPGTLVSVSYRWEPGSTLTKTVGEFKSVSGDGWIKVVAVPSSAVIVCPLASLLSDSAPPDEGVRVIGRGEAAPLAGALKPSEAERLAVGDNVTVVYRFTPSSRELTHFSGRVCTVPVWGPSGLVVTVESPTAGCVSKKLTFVLGDRTPPDEGIRKQTLREQLERRAAARSSARYLRLPIAAAGAEFNRSLQSGFSFGDAAKNAEAAAAKAVDRGVAEASDDELLDVLARPCP